MRPDLRLDPEVLERAAARLRGLASDLGDTCAPVLTGECGTTAGRIADELESLAGTAVRSAAAAREADRVAAGRFGGTRDSA
ncbi:hypothetical protein H7X46_01615 [Pseudonocardia sp. C8]|uniref:hypothetical protein n=1 Tax=Pseudonocardia sp. C8 TaxID=2762759 RepID=UPI0016434D95|nr:hypothetical protein [Pseudonocardia sp. C8]MBC3189762.1 hypothetical protein [Pseudonocardia sp. C8]